MLKKYSFPSCWSWQISTLIALGRVEKRSEKSITRAEGRSRTGNTEQVDFPRRFHVAFLAVPGLVGPTRRLTSLKLGRGAIGLLLPPISRGKASFCSLCLPPALEPGSSGAQKTSVHSALGCVPFYRLLSLPPCGLSQCGPPTVPTESWLFKHPGMNHLTCSP